MKRIITKDGKLFGIINVIDLLVLLFVIAAVAVVGYFLKNRNVTARTDVSFGGAHGNVEVVFYTEEVSNFVMKNVKQNDSYVCDDSCNNLLGRVVDVQTGPSLIYDVNAQGQQVASSKPDYCSAYISSVIPDALRTRFGFYYKKGNYGVGHSMVIRVDDAKIYLRIYDIHAAQRRQRRPIDTSSNRKYQEMYLV